MGKLKKKRKFCSQTRTHGFKGPPALKQSATKHRTPTRRQHATQTEPQGSRANFPKLLNQLLVGSFWKAKVKAEAPRNTGQFSSAAPNETKNARDDATARPRNHLADSHLLRSRAIITTLKKVGKPCLGHPIVQRKLLTRSVFKGSEGKVGRKSDGRKTGYARSAYRGGNHS